MESLWSSPGQVYSFHFTNSKVKLAFKPLHSGLFKSVKENLIKDKMLDYKLMILFWKGLHLFLASLVLVNHLCNEIKTPHEGQVILKVCWCYCASTAVSGVGEVRLVEGRRDLVNTFQQLRAQGWISLYTHALMTRKLWNMKSTFRLKLRLKIMNMKYSNCAV